MLSEGKLNNKLTLKILIPRQPGLMRKATLTGNVVSATSNGLLASFLIFVENSVTLNVIWETIEVVKQMGLDLGPLEEAANSNHTKPDDFNTRIRVSKICGNCVNLVDLTKASGVLANSIN